MTLSEREIEAFAAYQAAFSQQPPTNTDDLAAAIREFEALLPGWWWSVCVCSRTRDASCGPDVAGPDADLIESSATKPEDRIFDSGFHCDDPDGTLASSLRNVMFQAFIVRETARGRAVSEDMLERAMQAGAI